MRFVRLLWITSRPGGAWVGSVANKHNNSTQLGLGARISSRITMVIHVLVDHQINYNCFNGPFAASPYRNLYWDMRGLIFETSKWLPPRSTNRLVLHHWKKHSAGIRELREKPYPALVIISKQQRNETSHNTFAQPESHSDIQNHQTIQTRIAKWKLDYCVGTLWKQNIVWGGIVVASKHLHWTNKVRIW